MRMAKTHILRKHMRAKLYDSNGTNKPKPVIKRVFIPSDRTGEPLLLLLCLYTKKDKNGKFEYCVFGDRLYGENHVPSDSFGSGTKREALEVFKEHVFHSITGIWPWVIDEAWKTTKSLWQTKQDKIKLK